MTDSERIAAYHNRLNFYAGAQHATTGRRRRDEVRIVANYTRVLVEIHATATLAGLRVTYANTPLDLDTAKLLTWLRTAIVLGDAVAYVDRTGTWRILHPEHLFYDGDQPRIQHTPEYAETWTPSTLTTYTPQGTHTYPNPYGTVPVVHLRGYPSANPTWGHSMIDDLAPVARALNERLSQYLWLLRTQASPPIAARGLAHASLRVEPGEVWLLPRDAEVSMLRLLDKEAASINTDAIHILSRILRELANVPDIALGIGNTALSGEAIRRAYYPLLQATATRRALLTPALHQLAHAVLAVRATLNAAPKPDPSAIHISYEDEQWTGLQQDG